MKKTWKEPTEEWESRCRRCGRCCHEKVEHEGVVYYTQTPCEWLDPVTLLCTVYPDRHRVRRGCVPLTREVIGRGILPADCPYVQGIPGYPAPRLGEDGAE